MIDSIKSPYNGRGDVIIPREQLVQQWAAQIGIDNELPYELALSSAERMYQTLQEVYRMLGMPFGNSHEGLVRWMEQQSVM